eukprot:219518-Chlamydomonas_euryale.AAC.1
MCEKLLDDSPQCPTPTGIPCHVCYVLVPINAMLYIHSQTCKYSTCQAPWPATQQQQQHQPNQVGHGSHINYVSSCSLPFRGSYMLCKHCTMRASMMCRALCAGSHPFNWSDGGAVSASSGMGRLGNAPVLSTMLRETLLHTHIYCFDCPTCIPYKPDVHVASRAPCPPCVRPKLPGCNTILKTARQWIYIIKRTISK